MLQIQIGLLQFVYVFILTQHACGGEGEEGALSNNINIIKIARVLLTHVTLLFYAIVYAVIRVSHAHFLTFFSLLFIVIIFSFDIRLAGIAGIWFHFWLLNFIYVS